MYDVRWVISLGIEGGREGQHVRGTEFHAKAASFATLDDDRNTSFCHEIPQLGSEDSVRAFKYAGCDYAASGREIGVMVITDCGEAEHDAAAGNLPQAITGQRLTMRARTTLYLGAQM